MKEKNRFSLLLEHLMSMANLKNYVLAQTLKYDESYISKWVSGKMLPTEKNYDKILQDISNCIVNSLTEETLDNFFLEYQLNDINDLPLAIYDHLETEYNYVKNLKNSSGSEIASKIEYFPELPLGQFISKMKHPSLRKVNSLNVCALIDIMHLDTDYQLMIVDFNHMHLEKELKFPGVHFSLFINLNNLEKSASYTSVFLMNMLTNLSNINFSLYGGQQATDKIIFAVKDAYSISGMLIDNSHCLAVTVSEDVEIANSIYKKIQSICNRENLLIRNTTMYEMIESYDYEQSIFSKNKNWLVGHMTEHFIPDDLHQELLDTLCKDLKKQECDKLSRLHILTRKILDTAPIRIVMYEAALTNFSVTGILDFYGTKVHLTSDQRLRYMKHLCELMTNQKNLEFRILTSRIFADFPHIPEPTLFLSDALSYLRLDTISTTYNVTILNKIILTKLFRQFFAELWDSVNSEFYNGDNYNLDLIQHLIFSIEIMSELND